MSTQPSPATFTFVTGHEFGEATFRTILGLPEYGFECFEDPHKLKPGLAWCLIDVAVNVSGYSDSLSAVAANCDVTLETTTSAGKTETETSSGVTLVYGG